jgi:hypothetical protein
MNLLTGTKLANKLSYFKGMMAADGITRGTV